MTFTFCKKPKKVAPEEPAPVTTEMQEGLPPNFRKINGYFYGCLKTAMTFNTTRTLLGFGCFGEPARSLLINYNHQTDIRFFGGSNNSENIHVKGLSFGGRQLTASGSGSYQLFTNSISNLDYSTNWFMEGNGSFVRLDLSVPRGYPKIAEPPMNPTFSISVGQDFTYTISDAISNYDSVCVRLTSTDSPFTGIRKSVSSEAQVVTFTKQELSSLYPTNYGTLVVMAFNYSNKIVKDKIYVFELSNKLERTVIIKE